MLNKKVMMLAVLIVCLFAISAVSANENITQDAITANQDESIDSIKEQGEVSNVLSEEPKIGSKIVCSDEVTPGDILFLKDMDGNNISDAELIFSVYGDPDDQDPINSTTFITNNEGAVEIPVLDLSEGNYITNITFLGTDQYKASTKYVKLIINANVPENQNNGNSTELNNNSGANSPTSKTPIKTTLTLKKVTVKKSAKKLTIQATLKLNGKAVKGKIIKFKFNKKSYKVKTNAKGVAKITVKKSVLKKLKKGKKVTYTATYDKITKKVTVKVK